MVVKTVVPTRVVVSAVDSPETDILDSSISEDEYAISGDAATNKFS